jgi:hypothetical protein
MSPVFVLLEGEKVEKKTLCHRFTYGSDVCICLACLRDTASS